MWHCGGEGLWGCVVAKEGEGGGFGEESTGVRVGEVTRGPAHDAERGWVPYRTVTSRTTLRRSPCSAAIKHVGAAPQQTLASESARKCPAKAESRSVAPRPADEGLQVGTRARRTTSGLGHAARRCTTTRAIVVLEARRSSAALT